MTSPDLPRLRYATPTGGSAVQVAATMEAEVVRRYTIFDTRVVR